ncbi:MAG TPA: hypothetical protein VJ742_06550, partial [Nitrososphaera sp.]|nr:hypothetical protein [Nitrososphaera sp.]
SSLYSETQYTFQMHIFGIEPKGMFSALALRIVSAERDSFQQEGIFAISNGNPIYGALGTQFL